MFLNNIFIFYQILHKIILFLKYFYAKIYAKILASKERIRQNNVHAVLNKYGGTYYVA